MIVKPTFILLAVVALAVLTPNVDSTKLLAKKALLNTVKTKATAIAKGKALAIKTAVTLPVKLLKSKVATVSSVFKTGPIALALGRLTAGTPVVSTAPAVDLSFYSFPASTPSFSVSNVNPALSVQFPAGYTNYYGDGFNYGFGDGSVYSAPGVAVGPTGSDLLSAGLARTAAVGGSLAGAAAGAATAAGLSTFSNVAARLTNAAETAETLQSRLLKSISENPVVSYVQNALRPATPAPLTFNYLPEQGFTSYHSFQYHPPTHGGHNVDQAAVPEYKPEPAVETSTPAVAEQTERPVYGLPAIDHTESPVYGLPAVVEHAERPVYGLPVYGLPPVAPQPDNTFLYGLPADTYAYNYNGPRVYYP